MTLSPNAVTLGVRVLTYKSEGDTVHSTVCNRRERKILKRNMTLVWCLLGKINMVGKMMAEILTGNAHDMEALAKHSLVAVQSEALFTMSTGWAVWKGK